MKSDKQTLQVMDSEEFNLDGKFWYNLLLKSHDWKLTIFGEFSKISSYISFN